MSEANWPQTYADLQFKRGTWYAQSFSPLISHNIKYIKLRIGSTGFTEGARVSIHYEGVDGFPISTPIAQSAVSKSSSDYARAPRPTITKLYPYIRLVAGISYFIILHTTDRNAPRSSITSYSPLPSTYPRGKLIKSTNAGSTWSPTDLGDLVFGEWGDPPLRLIPYDPSVDHFAVLQLHKAHYSTSVCITTTTSQPCHLTCLVTDIEPKSIGEYRVRRGVATWCPKLFSFATIGSFEQLQDGDTLFHSFRPTKLKTGTKYYFAFTGTDDWTAAKSVSPIFGQVFPGGPPWETVRRPNAPGDACAIPREVGDPCPDHYLNVDESTPDEDTTKIYTRGPWTAWWADLYNIPDLEPGDEGPFAEVHLTARLKRTGGYAYAAQAGIILLTHGTVYYSDLVETWGTTWKNYHWHVYNNPFTDLPWTPAEINALQIGVRLGHYTGVGWGTDMHCTQVYCTIKHSCNPYQ